MNITEIEALQKQYADKNEIKLSHADLEDILSIALNTNVSLHVETEVDYSDCYYEGDIPGVCIESYNISVQK